MPSRRPAILLDSSVIIKWVLAESDSNRAVELQERFLQGDIDLYLPDLALYEVANALIFSRIFSAEQVQDCLTALLDLDLSILPFDFGCLARAVELAMDRELAIYDSYFVAYAEVNGFQYLTADRRAARRLGDLSFVVVLQ